MILLTGLYAVPFFLTHILFCSYHYENEKKTIRRKLLPEIVLNLTGNGIFEYLLLRWGFHSSTPWKQIADIIRLRCTYSDLRELALILLICAFAGVFGGLILRFLFLRKVKSGITSGRKAAALALFVLCAAAGFAGMAGARAGNRCLRIEEVYRKTGISMLDAERVFGSAENNDRISCVAVYNEGILDCTPGYVWLSDSEDQPLSVRTPDLYIPSHEARFIVMDYDHGIDLKKNGYSTVYLSSRDGKLLDEVRVPGLQEDESYCRTAENDREWRVINHKAAPVYTVQAPSFSVESGFYSMEFDLTISGNPGTTIYFTLDGSVPDADSFVYRTPIRIEDASRKANVWSSRTDVSAAFLMEDPDYSVPDHPVDKCTVVRAVCANEYGETSDVVTGCFFVGFDDRYGYKNQIIVNIVMDPRDLFDEMSGIYVLGNTYKEQYDPKTNRGYWWWPANYHQRGREWEREADIQVFDTDRRLMFTKRMGLRVKGGASAGYLPKGLNLYARKQYDGEPRLAEDLFGTGYLAKRISISAGGNSTDIQAKDWLVTQLAGDLDIPMGRMEACCVFLDGEYWGTGWLSEQLDDIYFRYYYDVPENNVAVIKRDRLKIGEYEAEKHYRDMVAYITGNDMRDEECYAKAGEMLDLEETMRYMAVELYIGNMDWSMTSNSLLWRSLSLDREGYSDGRWRWGLFDVNHRSVFSNSHNDDVKRARNKFPLFDSLMNNEHFYREFYETLKQIAEVNFAPERTAKAISEYRELKGEGLNANSLRYHNTEADLEELDSYQRFFEERREYILAQCETALSRQDG